MKKIIRLSIFILVFSGIVFNQSITLIKPSDADNWCKGQTYQINWTDSGTSVPNVKIRLYNTESTVKILNITNSTPNTGSYNWVIPNSISPNCYRIRVKTTDNNFSDDSNIFKISDCSSASINVLNPLTWCNGQSHSIKWTKSGNMNSNVKIRLYNSTGTNKILNITNSTANDGNYDWNIPATVSPGEYRIRVKTVDNLVFDDSSTFLISDCSGKLKVTSPCEYGSTVTLWGNTKTLIKWNNSPCPGGNVRITMTYTNCPGASGPIPLILFIISNSTPNDGSFSWTTPDASSIKCYKITVSKLNNNCAGSSGTIRIRPKLIIIPWDKFKLTKKMWIKIPEPDTDPWCKINLEEIIHKVKQSKSSRKEGLIIALKRGSEIVKKLGKVGKTGVIEWNIATPVNGIAILRLVKPNIKINRLSMVKKQFKLLLFEEKSGAVIQEIPLEIR